MIYTVVPVNKIVHRRDGTTYTRKLSDNERAAIMRRARTAPEKPSRRSKPAPKAKEPRFTPEQIETIVASARRSIEIVRAGAPYCDDDGITFAVRHKQGSMPWDKPAGVGWELVPSYELEGEILDGRDLDEYCA